MSQTKIDISNLADSVIAALSVPKINAIDYPGDDTAADPAGGQLITLTGSGFNTGAQIYIDGTLVSIVSVLSSNELTFVSPAKSSGSYELSVINTDGGIAASVNNIEYSGLPTWQTPTGSLANVYEGGSVTASLSATSDSAITYSLTSGSLPTGVTLSGNTVSGTAGSVVGNTTYNFTIDAIDLELQNTSRNFNIGVLADTVTWNSPANNFTTTANNVSSITPVLLNATAASGGNVTYSANALPSGITLTSGTISGTSTVVANTSSLITATSPSGKTANITLNFEITSSTVAPGQIEFLSVGNTSWVVPTGVTEISAVCVGGGGRGLSTNSNSVRPSGGAGGDLRYSSSISVTPGETLTITVGSGGNNVFSRGRPSSINRGSVELLSAAGGDSGRSSNFPTPNPQYGNSTPIGGSIGGGNGGTSTPPTSTGYIASGGGGAGGYSGNGGTGLSGTSGYDGVGGAGGGGCAQLSPTGYYGGGVQIYGKFNSGLGADAALNRSRGSQGSRPDGATTVQNQSYGGGGGGKNNGGTPDDGAQGAVRIIWGTGRAYPATNTQNM